MDDIQWGAVTGWCQISASVDKFKYSASDKVYISVVVKNVSDHPAKYQPFPFAPGVDYKVIYSGGSSVDLTAFGRLMRDSAGVSSSAIENLAPGEEVVYEVFLNRRYDITRAAQYQFQVFRQIEVDNHGNTSIAVSNPIVIEVVERE